MATWNIKYGKWWMVQWCWDRWISLGVHVDTKRRYTGRQGIAYGPYIDIHLPCVIVSFGVNPIYSSDIEQKTSIARGGISGNDN